MSRKVLLLSCGVPPSTNGSSVIVSNLARQFTRDEMVVIGEWPHGRPPVRWQENWPRIQYDQMAWPCHNRGLQKWRVVQFPWLLLKVLWTIWRRRIGTIVAVFPGTHFLLAGYICAKLTRRRLFVYLHNTYLENCSGIGLKFARWFQPRVFKQAEHVFVMSEGMRELYAQRYPELKNCSALLHTFNEPIPDVEAPPVTGDKVRLVLIGNINESCRDAAARMGEAIAQTSGAELVTLTGTARAALEAAGLLRKNMQQYTVSRDHLVEELRQFDIALLPHGLTGDRSPEEYQTIFPTRTVEYLISGRPILAHVPADCYLDRFLKETQCALVVNEPDVEALKKAIETLRTDQDLRVRLVRNALRAAERFYAPRVAAGFRRRVGLVES